MIPVKPAVPDTGNGAATTTSASSTPAVNNALTYIDLETQVMLWVSTFSPCPFSVNVIFAEEMAREPMTAGDNRCPNTAFSSSLVTSRIVTSASSTPNKSNISCRCSAVKSLPNVTTCSPGTASAATGAAPNRNKQHIRAVHFPNRRIGQPPCQTF